MRIAFLSAGQRPLVSRLGGPLLLLCSLIGQLRGRRQHLSFTPLILLLIAGQIWLAYLYFYRKRNVVNYYARIGRQPGA